MLSGWIRIVIDVKISEVKNYEKVVDNPKSIGYNNFCVVRR